MKLKCHWLLKHRLQYWRNRYFWYYLLRLVDLALSPARPASRSKAFLSFSGLRLASPLNSSALCGLKCLTGIDSAAIALFLIAICEAFSIFAMSEGLILMSIDDNDGRICARSAESNAGCS